MIETKQISLKDHFKITILGEYLNTKEHMSRNKKRAKKEALLKVALENRKGVTRKAI